MRRLPLVVITVFVAVWLCQRDPVRARQSVLDTAGFVARTYNGGSQTMPYRLFIPRGYEQKRQYPLVVSLHGSSGGGTDNLKQLAVMK